MLREPQISHLPILLLLFLASGCGQVDNGAGADQPALPEAVVADATGQDVRTATWDCDGLAVAGEFSGNTLTLTFDGQTEILTQAISGSGARYTTTESLIERVFWIKGSNARFMLDADTQVDCKIVSGAQDDDDHPVYLAHGNEPGWSLAIDGEQIELTSDYGANSVTTSVAAISESPTGRIYRADAGSRPLTIDITEALCHDSMSGAVYPESVRVTLDDQTLIGCGGDIMSLLSGNAWRVIEIDGAGVIGDTPVTLNFSADGQLSGSSGCNQYGTSFIPGGEGVEVGLLRSTMMACSEELMEQEQRFGNILSAVTHFDIDAGGALRLSSDQGKTIKAVPD